LALHQAEGLKVIDEGDNGAGIEPQDGADLT